MGQPTPNNPEQGQGAPEVVDAGIQAMLENAKRLGLVWTLRLATVIRGSDVAAISAVYDGDTQTISMTSVIGPLAIGARVYVVMVPPSGNYIIGTVSTAPTYRYAETLPFFADDTFTKSQYPNLGGVISEIWGGGGGSGGCASTIASQAAVGGCGGAGGYSRKWIPADSLQDVETILVALGGTAGAAGANNGGNGGDTLFGSHHSALGGAGGTGGAATGGSTLVGGGDGGTASGGDWNVTGDDGDFGQIISLVPIRMMRGGGGPFFGGTGRVTGSGSGGNGNQGSLFGSGATGALNLASQSARAGAAGRIGLCLLHLYMLG